MKTTLNVKFVRGQSSLEYLLLLAVVAVVVIASFGPGALIDQIRNTAGGYYNSATRVIMDSDGANQSSKEIDNPQPINGGWCPITCPTGSGPQNIYGACECPAPAFGGAICPAGVVQCGAGQTCKGQEVICNGVSSCGTCPTGQQCLPGGKCGCADNLTCNGQGGSPTGSVPDALCQNCICPSGYAYNVTQNACTNNCSQPCTTWNGTACVAVTCGQNQTCNASLSQTNPSQECQCNQYTYWNGAACVFCQSAAGQCTAPDSAGTGCQVITCPSNMNCNAGANACQCDYSPPNFCTQWNGTACVAVPCPCTPQVACPSANGCDTDSCGNTCGSGTCPAGAKCSSTVVGTPGVCMPTHVTVTLG